MKFIVSSANLKNQLVILNGIITTNPVVPILENFLFEIEDSELKITASDLQTSMITALDVEANENGSIAVPAKILLETLRNLPEQPVTFSIDESTYSIEINSDNGRYKLSGENATDFPKIPEAPMDVYSVHIGSHVLSKALGNTIFATSNDELRPAMTGVFFRFDNAAATLVATDSHRLIRYKRTDVVSESDHVMIIPRKALNFLKTTLPTEDTNVNILFNSSNAFFLFNDVKMVCRLIDERFPDYENVIPINNDNVMTIDKGIFLNSLKRIGIYANKTNHQIKLKITGSELVISAEDLDFSNEANERLVCEHDGEDIEIGFNAKFLLEILGTIDSDRVILKLSSSDRAGLLFPEDKDDNEDILMLVMPLMISDYA